MSAKSVGRTKRKFYGEEEGGNKFGDEEEEKEEEEEEEEEEERPKSKKRALTKRSKTAQQTPSVKKDDSETAENVRLDMDNEDENDAEEKDVDYESGQIAKIQVENFMCHTKFTMAFGHHVNFITGRNGSGKSAIVAALQICLGATAKSTGRGNSTASMIREGSEGPAVIRVTLRNEGADAFRPDIYGKRITVERKIVKGHGATGYAIISADNKVQSTEKKELERILRNFNIFVENPCCVLTQEESKKFIQGSSKDKYDFFLKATGLHRTREDIKHMSDLLEEIDVTKAGAHKKLLEKSADCKRLKEELRELTSLDDMEREIQVAYGKLKWRQFFETNEKATAMKIEYDEQATYLSAKESAFLEAKRQLDELNCDDSVKSKIEQLRTQVDDDEKAFNEKRDEHKKVQREVQIHKREISEYQNGVIDYKRQMNTAKSDKQALINNSAATAGGDQNAIEQELENVERDKEKLRERDSGQQEDRSKIEAELVDINREVSAVTSSLRFSRQGIDRKRQERDSASNQTHDQVSKFGTYMPSLLRAIENNKTWKGNVLGPFGSHITLKDGFEQFSLPIEKAVSNYLSSFLVTNSDDLHKLNGIIQGLGIRGNRPTVYNVQKCSSRHRTPKIDNFTTVLDTLVISDDDIFNILVDRGRIEAIALAKDDDEVMNSGLVLGNSPKQSLVRGINKVLIQDGTQFTYRFGNQAREQHHYPCRNLLSTDTTAYLQGLDNEIKTSEDSMREEDAHLRTITERKNRLTARLRECDEWLRRNTADLKSLDKQHSKLVAKLREIEEASNVDTSAYDGVIDDCAKAIEIANEHIEGKKTFLHASEALFVSRREEMTAAERKLSLAQSELSKQEDILRRYVETRENLIQEIRNSERDFKQEDRRFKIMETAYNKQQSELDNHRAEAENFCSKNIEGWDGNPINVKKSETVDKLNGEIKALKQNLEKQVKAMKLAGKTVAKVTERYEKARIDLLESKAGYEVVHKNFESLKADLVSRKKSWKKQLYKSSVDVSLYFDEYMQKKGFAGTVKFDHKEFILDLQAQTDNNDDTTRCKDVRQLSGGERSYTTLCLLLALGHVVESPFRLMDEYDVFLDEISRKITLDEMEKYALSAQQRSRQFLIVTPHKISTKERASSNDVRIQKMSDPVRISAHGAQQSTLDAFHRN